MVTDVQEKSEPKYYLVKRHLLGLLPEFSPGVPLPTERELASTLATSRSTVRQALTELVVEGRLVRRLGRLRKVNGAPMALEQSHLPAARFPNLARAVRKTGSLYQALADQWGIKVVRAVETIETAPASPREAGLLQTDVGAPMMMPSRHSFDAEDTPVEWVRSFYRGDRYKFVATLGFDADPS